MKNMYDVAVIGGGPAGSSAARRLASAGAKAIVFERAKMPRRKVCGGALSEHAIKHLDFSIPDFLIDWECYGARVHYGSRTLTARLPERIAILTTRSDFDHFLASKAEEVGAAFQNVRVVKLSDERSNCCLWLDNGSEVHAKRVIIAGGANCRFISMVRPRDNADEEGICLEAEVPITSPDKFADLEGLIDIYFGGAAYGYGWVFHHGTYYSVGVGGVRSKFSNPMGTMKQFCDQLGVTGWESTVKGHPIPRGGINRRISKGNLYLAGDSAGFVDPFYGEGLAYAIRSGQLAAEAALVSLDGKVEDSHLEYSLSVEEEFNDNLSYSLKFSKLMYSMPRLFLTAMTADQSVLEKYLYVPLDKISYKSYLFWLLPRMPLVLFRMLSSLRGL